MSDVELRGIDRLLSSLDDFPKQLDVALAEADDKAGELLLARIDPPRDTGYLAAHIGYTVTPTGLQLVAAAPYAAATEKRRPWLAPAVAGAESDLTTIYTDAVVDAVETITGV